MKILFILASFLIAATFTSTAEKNVPEIKWDSKSLLIDGHRVMPVMGEVHYSRIPAEEWSKEIKKMKDGGVTVIAAYVFWNHIEEQEGIFDWSGQRDLRRFLEICKEEDMPVVLRMGPFCHGESRNGGIPDWVFKKGCGIREEDKDFLKFTARLYRQIYSQVQGLQWKDGGPVMAAQFDNEYNGHGSYLLSLKQIAEDAGFDLPFYTRTGWPELKTPIPYGEMIPLYGDYADGFWERSIEETAGNYYKAFNFSRNHMPSNIATEQFGVQESGLDGEQGYPYFTCELGGGMMTSYHRRPYLYPEDAYSMAVVKLGNGSNLLGYYMYHGGTNPEGYHSYLNETQRTLYTNYNDLPVKTYDFQAPLGEFGQINPHYYLLRRLHLFMQDYGEILAPMEATFPAPQELPKGDDSSLRWSYRAAGDSGFVFVNNYERLQNLTAKKGVKFTVGDVTFPSKEITIPAGTTCIFPVNIDGIRYATAQPIARRDGKIYLQQIKGIPTEIAIANGKVLKNLHPLGSEKPVWGNIYLLNEEQGCHLFLNNCIEDTKAIPAMYRKEAEAGTPRVITIGVEDVAEAPTDADFDNAAVYTISLPEERKDRMLEIDYRGDVARIYADGKLIADNFYNGRPMLLGLWRVPQDCKELTLRILPLQPDMPVYFPREADTTPGEAINSMIIR